MDEIKGEFYFFLLLCVFSVFCDSVSCVIILMLKCTGIENGETGGCFLQDGEQAMLFISFIEVSFTYCSVHPFQVNNSVVFTAFSEWCDGHH